MIGNFSFGTGDYGMSVDLWDCILSDLGIVDHVVKVHPKEKTHQRLWRDRGHRVELCEDCVWSDGNVGGYCCELFVGDLEIGNLVNPMGHSTDVGFGWERLHQVVEQVDRIDQTSLFNKREHPIVSDHRRTLSILWENGVTPGNRGRNYVCRRLIRRLLRHLDDSQSFVFDDWIRSETELRETNLRQGRRLWRKHKNKPVTFWWETFGILPEEIDLIRSD